MTTRVDGDWLREAGVQDLHARVRAAGHQIYFVGGCVRNGLLGRPVSDVDLATDASPDQVTAIAEEAGGRSIPTGRDHGTVTVVLMGTAYEVTTFRADVTTDGRHAEVAFTDDLATDAARRDFTMNALYADAAGEVIDPMGGLPDLYARRLRFVGDPAQRIKEDYLRILRFFRFHAQYGDPAQGIDADALAACAAGIDGLSKVSAERIGSEMRKLITAPDPAPALAAMEAAGVLQAILPGASPRLIAPLIHLAGDAGPSYEARLVALGGEGVAEAWRLTRAEAKGITSLRDAAFGAARGFELGYRLGAAMGRDALLLRAAMAEQPVLEADMTAVARGAAATLPIAAQDLLAEFQGPTLGQALRRAETAWLRADGLLEKSALLAAARQA